MKKLLALSLFLVACAPVSMAQAGDPAITDPAQVDQAYAWIGEYTGRSADREIGVRISVRDGKEPMFARLYVGGLPGLGWQTEEPELFTGTLEAAGLKLASKSGRKIESTASGLAIVESSGSASPLKKIARHGVTLGKKPPTGATVLFDGKPNDHWKNLNVSDDGLMQVGAETVEPFTGGYLHLEFRTPYMPKSSGQKRGNSGVYLQRRYEVQILDSFALPGIENECGAIYTQRKPDVNMALPPLVWQSYDIFFEPAKFSESGEKIKPTILTVIHNGVPVQYRNMVKTKTGAGKPEGPEPLPLLLQDHGDPVVFRNIWLVPSQSAPVAKPVGDRLTNWLAPASVPFTASSIDFK